MPETKPHVLLVEDDADLRIALAVLLRHDGFQVSMAEDALGALAIAVRQLPDLIVLDLGLPGGGGFSVMERMSHTRAASVPILILTASNDETHRDKALQMGAAGYLRKPMETGELLAAVRRFAGKEAAA